MRGAVVYVCGDAARLAPDVRNAFVEIYRGKTGDDINAAQKWLDDPRSSRRYVEDVWAAGRHGRSSTIGVWATTNHRPGSGGQTGSFHSRFDEVSAHAGERGPGIDHLAESVGDLVAERESLEPGVPVRVPEGLEQQVDPPPLGQQLVSVQAVNTPRPPGGEGSTPSPSASPTPSS